MLFSGLRRGFQFIFVHYTLSAVTMTGVQKVDPNLDCFIVGATSITLNLIYYIIAISR